MRNKEQEKERKNRDTGKKNKNKNSATGAFFGTTKKADTGKIV